MSSPQRPHRPIRPLTPLFSRQIDPSLLKLDGRAYKDRSHQAAAQRAAYYRARAAQFLTSSSSAPLAERGIAAQTTGIGNHDADFANFGTSPDWTPEYGTQESGGEGWIMHSQGNTSSRMKFNSSRQRRQLTAHRGPGLDAGRARQRQEQLRVSHRAVLC